MLFSKSYLAGILIGISCGLYCSIENKYLGAILFALALCSILRLELTLYTGRIHNLFDTIKQDGWICALFSYTIVFTLNLLGVLIISLLCDTMSIDWTNIALYKMSLSPIHVFCSSIICGALMTLAVLLYKKDTNPILTIMCISTFILIGAEHCIANIFYVSKELLAGNFLAVQFIALCAFGNSIGSILFNSLYKATLEE